MITFPITLFKADGVYPAIFNSAVQIIDPSDLSTVNGISVGDPLAQIDDITANGNHYIQGTSGDRPILRAGYIEGVSSDFMLCGTGVSKLSNHTVLVVYKLDGLGINQTIIGDAISSGATRTRSITVQARSDNKTRGSFGDGTNSRITTASTSATTNISLFNSRFPADSGALEELEIDGNAQTEVDTSGTATSIGGTAYQMAMFRTGEFSGNYMVGNINFIAIWSSRLSDTNNAIATDYLLNRFGI